MHDRRTCLDPRAIELRRTREQVLRPLLRPEAVIRQDSHPLLHPGQEFEWNKEEGVLYLTQKGPVAKEVFVLQQNVHTEDQKNAVLDLFSTDERHHLLYCDEYGTVLEPTSDDVCPLCFEPLFERYKIKKNLSCGHQVCLKCLPDLEKCEKCPVCRAQKPLQ